MVRPQAPNPNFLLRVLARGVFSVNGDCRCCVLQHSAPAGGLQAGGWFMQILVLLVLHGAGAAEVAGQGTSAVQQTRAAETSISV